MRRLSAYGKQLQTSKIDLGEFIIATHFIAGEYVKPHGTAIRDVINPVTGAVVDSTPRGTVDDVTDAVQAASDAFPGWWDTSGAARRGAIQNLMVFFDKTTQLDWFSLIQTDFQSNIAKIGTTHVKKILLEIKRL
ncbi:MAG: aldehyde dehydrogenase family protein [Chloroflexi bacterium]|nr:aldehyde dehydrogenase family protein [Chloroflexota bacterium]